MKVSKTLIYIIAVFGLWLYFKYGNFETTTTDNSGKKTAQAKSGGGFGSANSNFNGGGFGGSARG